MVGSLFSSPPVVAAVGDDRPPDGAALAAGTADAGAGVVGLGELELQAASPIASPIAPIAAAIRTLFVIPLPLSVSCGT